MPLSFDTISCLRIGGWIKIYNLGLKNHFFELFFYLLKINFTFRNYLIINFSFYYYNTFSTTNLGLGLDWRASGIN